MIDTKRSSAERHPGYSIKPSGALRALVCAVLAVTAFSTQSENRSGAHAAAQPELGSRSVPVIEVDGYRFRDLDRNGQLTPYEDWRLGAKERAADLVTRMTLEKKAAESTRLGIPVTISSDPRYVFKSTYGISVATERFTKWPDAPGFGAIGDADLVRQFAQIVAQEYRAVGINMALSPQADVATARAVAPFQQPHKNNLFGRFQHEGDLDFKPDNTDLKTIREIATQVPTIVTIDLERPAILTPVRELAAVMIGNFGVSDEALLNLISGRAQPDGKLPFELPSSMAAAAAQLPDVPHDSVDPLYPIGYGLSY